MALIEAMKILLSKYPQRIVVGYWEKEGNYVFNTKTSSLRKGIDEPGQYVVTKDGTVYATNPMQSDLDISKMKKIR